MENTNPSVLNVMTLCVYPMATTVSVVSSITGLDNFILGGESKFNKKIGDLLNIFLSCFPPPVYFIAHNRNLNESYVGIMEKFNKRRKKATLFSLIVLSVQYNYGCIPKISFPGCQDYHLNLSLLG
jgi:hypothetical protein